MKLQIVVFSKLGLAEIVHGFVSSVNYYTVRQKNCTVLFLQ